MLPYHPYGRKFERVDTSKSFTLFENRTTNCNIQFYRYQSTYADIHADDYLVFECMQSLNNMFHIILLCKC